MRFRYIGEYPEDKQEAVFWGHNFRGDEMTTVPDGDAARYLKNRFFEIVNDEGPRNRLLDPSPVDFDPFEGMDRDALIAIAEEKGVKIDKRWTHIRIAAAIKDAENDSI